MAGFTNNLEAMFQESAQLEVDIKTQLAGVKYE